MLQNNLTQRVHTPSSFGYCSTCEGLCEGHGMPQFRFQSHPVYSAQEAGAAAPAFVSRGARLRSECAPLMLRAGFGAVTLLAVVAAFFGVMWTAQGVDDSWVTWMTAGSLSWLGLVGWAVRENYRQGYHR